MMQRPITASLIIAASHADRGDHSKHAFGKACETTKGSRNAQFWTQKLSEAKREASAYPRASAALGSLITAAVAAVGATSAAAQTTVYESNDVSLEVAADATAVVFTQNNSWFGEPEANIGADTDSWVELAFEPQLYLKIGRAHV